MTSIAQGPARNVSDFRSPRAGLRYAILRFRFPAPSAGSGILAARHPAVLELAANAGTFVSRRGF